MNQDFLSVIEVRTLFVRRSKHSTQHCIMHKKKDSIKNNIPNPCESPFVIPGINDKLCNALIDNDLDTILKEKRFNYLLCHSRDDKVVSIKNIPQEVIDNQDDLHTVHEIFGDHFYAGVYCTFSFLDYFISNSFLEYDASRNSASLVKIENGGCR